MIQLLTSVFSFCASQKCKLIENLSAGCGSDDGFFLLTNDGDGDGGQWPLTTLSICVFSGYQNPIIPGTVNVMSFYQLPVTYYPSYYFFSLGKGSEIALCGTFSSRGSARRLHLRL